MKQLTIRGFDDELQRRLRGLANAEGVSLNQAALRLMQRGAGLGRPGERGDVVGSSLDHLAGTWTRAEGREIEKALEGFDAIDRDFWRRPRPRRRKSPR